MKPTRTLPYRIMASLIAGMTFAFVFSCATVQDPSTIPADLSEAKFFQAVQEQIDAEQYDTAMMYLSEFRKRFGTSTDQATLDRMVEADYLTAHISYSRGKLAEARAQFVALLKQYNGVPEEATSPPRWIKILCKRLIESLDKKLGTNEPSPTAANTPTTTTIAPPATGVAPTGASPKP